MNQTRALVEGAITVAIFTIILLITLYIVPLSLITVWLLPLPIIYYIARVGLRLGIVAFFVALMITLIIYGPLSLVLSAYFLITGMVMGYLVYRKHSIFAILLGGSLSNIAMLLIMYGVSKGLFHFDPVTAIQSTVSQSVKSTASITSYFGGNSKQQMAVLKQQISDIQYYIPYFIVMIGVTHAFIIELLSTPILKRLRVDFPKWPPLHTWHFPKNVIWYYLVILIITLLVPMTPKDSLFMVVVNIYKLLETVMAIQGITFIFYFFYAKKMRKALPIAALILMLLLPPVLYIIKLLGIIDLGFDLRARLKKK